MFINKSRIASDSINTTVLEPHEATTPKIFTIRTKNILEESYKIQ